MAGERFWGDLHVLFLKLEGYIVWNTVWVIPAYSVTVSVDAPGTVACDGPAWPGPGPGPEKLVSAGWRHISTGPAHLRHYL